MSRHACRDLAIGVSLANLCYLHVWAEIFSLDHPRNSYYLKLAPVDFAAVVLNVLCLGAVFSIAATLVRRLDHPAAFTGARWAFLLVLLVPLNDFRRKMPGLEIADVVALLHQPGWVALGLALALGAAWAVVRWHARLVRVVATIVLVLAPFTGVTFARTAWSLARYHASGAFVEKGLAPPLPVLPPPDRRVVLLVFDGMDQRLAFDERPPGVDLPEFDRLKAQAISASHAYPPARDTLHAIPALLTGVGVSTAEPVCTDELMLTFEGDEEPTGWSTAPNLFSKIRALGLNTAAVGWYHPYCRVLHKDLTRCYWHPSGTVSQGGDSGLLLTMRDQLVSLSPWFWRVQFLKAYRNILDEAKMAVADRTLSLLFVHLPVPHRPWIYDRQREGFTLTNYPFAGYFDNLVLADRTLGQLRHAMEAAGTWTDTIVLVTADHSWVMADRFDGKTDPRVPFMLRLAGQTEGLTYDPPLSTLVLSELTAALLRGEVQDASDVVRWLHDQRSLHPQVAATSTVE